MKPDDELEWGSLPYSSVLLRAPEGFRVSTIQYLTNPN